MIGNGRIEIDKIEYCPTMGICKLRCPQFWKQLREENKALWMSLKSDTVRCFFFEKKISFFNLP